MHGGGGPGSGRARLEEEVAFLRASAFCMAEGSYDRLLRKRLIYRTRSTSRGPRRRT